MIFVQPFFDNFCDKFLSHTQIMFLLSLFIALDFVSISHFPCKFMVVQKVVIQMVVQITQLKKLCYLYGLCILHFMKYGLL